MKFFLTLFLLLFTILSIQSQSDSIHIDNRGKEKYFQNGKELSAKDLAVVFKLDEKAFLEYNKGVQYRQIKNIFQFAGGFCIGFAVGNFAFGNGDYYQAVKWITVGGISLGISIPFSSRYKRHVKNAIFIYNDGLDKKGKLKVSQLDFGISSNGVGFYFKF